jgi:hypothetical protein
VDVPLVQPNLVDFVLSAFPQAFEKGVQEGRGVSFPAGAALQSQNVHMRSCIRRLLEPAADQSRLSEPT